MTQAGERDVGTTDEVALPRRVSEQARARLHRAVRIHVELDRDLRIRELRFSRVDDVAPEQQLFALALDHVRRMTHGMSWRRQRADSGEECCAALERTQLPGCCIRVHCC